METTGVDVEKDPNLLAEAVGFIFYHFSKVQPFIPTYAFLFAGALFPIYAGSHASLHRPVSANPAPKRKDDGSAIEVSVEEETASLAGFEWLDVALYPIFAAVTLAGLYWLIKYLEESALAIITVLLNGYMSVFGLLGLFSLLSDGSEVLLSYVFPSAYLDGDRVWIIDDRRRLALPSRISPNDRHPGYRYSPLPSGLSRLGIPNGLLWRTRELLLRPAVVFELQVYRLVTTIKPNAVRILCAMVALAAVVYFNAIDRAWWLTNILGFSFTYSAFQIVSPTTFKIGTLLLITLLFYDIYMVFFTPMMITVATKLDIPAKIMFPNPEVDGRSNFSMLGLGDIVIPGIVMAMALRFDLYMFYLKKQRLRSEIPDQAVSKGATDAEGKANTTPSENPDDTKDQPKRDSEENKQEATKPSKAEIELAKNDYNAMAKEKYVKAVYKRVTSTWGDRFWLGKYGERLVGGSFPKPYFHSSLIGYVIGLSTTLLILQIYEHGQPALLYLVPGVLVSIWLTAFIRGEARVMWIYTEDRDDGREAGIDSARILERQPSVTSNQAKPVARKESISNAKLEVKHSKKAPEKQKLLEKAGSRDGAADAAAAAADNNGDGHSKAESKAVELKESLESTELARSDNTRKKEPALPRPARQRFRLNFSFPRHYQAPTVQSGAKGVSDAKQTTIDWADGEPLEKRRRTL